MPGIGVVGTGISGLTLALYLQQQGVEVTVYSDQTPEELRAGRLPNTVVRFHPARERERLLGVDHWEFADFGVSSLQFRVYGEHPLAFCGHLRQQASAVDFRIYLARLLEDFERRGVEWWSAGSVPKMLRASPAGTTSLSWPRGGIRRTSSFHATHGARRSTAPSGCSVPASTTGSSSPIRWA